VPGRKAPVPPGGVDVLAVVLPGEPRPPAGPGVAREVGAAARLQRRERRVARPAQKGDAPQLGAVLERRGGELEALEAAEEEDGGEAESPRGEARCYLESEGVGAVGVVHDWGPRLPRVPGEVDLEVVPAEAAPAARVVQRPERELVDLGGAELDGLSPRRYVIEGRDGDVGRARVPARGAPGREPPREEVVGEVGVARHGEPGRRAAVRAARTIPAAADVMQVLALQAPVRAGAGEGGVDGEEDDDAEEGREREVRDGRAGLPRAVVVAPARELLGGWWLLGVPGGEGGGGPEGRREVRQHCRAGGALSYLGCGLACVRVRANLRGRV
jgi:hypothetical protein